MKHFLKRVVIMIIGLFFYALGIVITIKANIGYAPWEVFHAGLANTFGFSIGFFSIIVGIVVVITVILLGEKIGFGTISNMILIGIFIDLILFLNIIPTPENLIFCVLMLILGLFTISVGSYFYIKTGFGAGPRDSLMVVLTRKTKIAVGICRSLIELFVTVIGWLLGGMVGLGTIISVIGIGFCIQITFKLFRFDSTLVKHETFSDTIASLKRKQ